MSILRLTGVTVDLERGLAVRKGAHLPLTDLELRLLVYLREAGAAVSRGRLLEAVWGYRPGVESRTVDTTMRRLREKVELDPDAPRHLLTVHGQGYRFAGAPSLAPTGPVIGRTGEISALRAALDRARVVTVVGRPGQGRGTLARAVAQTWGPATELRVEGAQDEEALDRALAHGLGLRGAGPRLLRDLHRLGEHLLLLRAETPTDRALARRWLGARLSGGLRAVVVADAPLHLPDEVVLPLGGLEEGDALALLRQRAGAQPSDEALRRLARAWDGWPLALLHLGEHLRAGAAAAAQPTLNALLARSWSDTDPPAREALARLAIGAPPEDLPEGVARWLGRGQGRPELPPAVAQWIRALPEGQRAAEARAEACLAEIAADPDGPWEREAEQIAHGSLPGPLRVAAALALAERALTARSDALATPYLDLARELEPEGPRAARRRLLEARARVFVGDHDRAAQILAPLHADPQLDAALRAEARVLYASVHLARLDLAGARALLAEPAPTPTTQLLRASVQAALAQVSAAPDALVRWRRVLAEAARQGRPRLIARWAPNLALALREAHREDEADRVFRRALTAQAEVGDARAEVYTRIWLAQARYDRGDGRGATEQLDLAEALLEHRDQPRERQHLLALRAGLALEAEDPVAALSCCEEASALGAIWFITEALTALVGAARWLAGDLVRAEAALLAAARDLDALQDRDPRPSLEPARQLNRARLLAVRAERGACAPADTWPRGDPTDPVSAAIDVERLHLRLHEGGLAALREGWRALGPPMSGTARVSRLLLRARLQRTGLNPSEVL